MTPSLVLASASPFRRALLENAGLVFTARAAEIDERALEKPLEEEGAAPEDVAVRLAEAKATDVARHFPEALVIGSDQTMSLGQRVYHKPKDMAEAGQHLLSLAGKTHRLNSAIVLVHGEQILWRHVSSAHMSVRMLTPEFVDRHLQRVGSKALSSVGAYQLEG
ncbi:MAG: Maf-like protein, partial [Ensifer adhaerens]